MMPSTGAFVPPCHCPFNWCNKPMKPCDKCLEQRWEYQKLPDCYIRATCENCHYEVEWQSKKLLAASQRRSNLLKGQTGSGAGEGIIWTMENGKHFRDGVEMVISRKGRDEKCTIGYAKAKEGKLGVVNPLTYVQPPQKPTRTGFLKDV